MDSEVGKSMQNTADQDRQADLRATVDASPDDSDSSSDQNGMMSPNEKYADRITIYNSRSEVRSPARMAAGIVRDFGQGRELAWRLFLRNLRGMYRQTLLGLFWAFLPPLANTAMWIFLKNAGAFKMEGTNVDATVFILTGMILWQAFIDAFQMPLNALQKNKNMISRLSFPREALLTVGFAEVMFNLSIRLLLLIPAFIWFNVELHWTIAFAPVAIFGLVLFGIALGLLIMPLGSLYQDVGRFLSIALPFWMIITPIIYVPWTTYPGNLLNWVNPTAPLLIMARDLLLVGPTSPHLMMGWICLGLTIPLIVLGLVVYRVSLPVLIERMQA